MALNPAVSSFLTRLRSPCAGTNNSFLQVLKIMTCCTLFCESEDESASWMPEEAVVLVLLFGRVDIPAVNCDLFDGVVYVFGGKNCDVVSAVMRHSTRSEQLSHPNTFAH